jgi:hypothetical protein
MYAVPDPSTITLRPPGTVGATETTESAPSGPDFAIVRFPSYALAT